MAAALGYDCADCHVASGTDKADWVFDTPKKKTARKMVEMVSVINKPTSPASNGDLLDLPSRPLHALDHHRP